MSGHLEQFQRRHDRRIAAFIAPDVTEVVNASLAETGVHAGTCFRLAPQLEDLDRTPGHAILDASQGDVHLYRSSSGVLSRQDGADMPASLRDVSKFTDQQDKGNIHIHAQHLEGGTGGRSGGAADPSPNPNRPAR